MPVDNTIHLIGFRVPVYNLTPVNATTVYETGVYEPNVFE